MNWLDVVLLIVLALSTARSFLRGFSREVIGVGAALLALVLAMWFYGTAGSIVLPYVSSPQVANFVGFFLVMFGILFLGWILGIVVSRFIRTVGLSVFDRTLGAAFGLLRGLLIAIALLTAFMAFGPHREADAAPAAVLNSRIAPYVLRASRAFVAIAPMDLKRSFQTRYAQIMPRVKKRGTLNGNERESQRND